jgi:hypothetical protein
MGSQVQVHDSSHPACQVYGSIPSFNSRSDMLDVPASAYFEKYNHPEIYDYYKDTIMRCRKFSARRNDVGHGTCWPKGERGYYWIPPYYNSRKFPADKDPVYEYRSKEILYYADRLSGLIGAVSHLNSLSFKAREQMSSG